METSGRAKSPVTDSLSVSKCLDMEVTAPPHKPLRFCRSIGEDSAIGMQLSEETLLNNADTVSEGSFRSVSQTDDRIHLNAGPSDAVSMAPTEQPTFSKDLNSDRHVGHIPLGRQRSTDTSKFFAATPSSYPPSRQNSVVHEPAFETYNPMFSRAPSTMVSQGAPHMIHHANTFPALHPITEGQTMQVPQYQMRNFQYTSQPQAVLHASNGQLVPLRAPGYGVMCASNGSGVYGPSYYTVQHPPSVGDMSRMSSQACFSPEQPHDVRVSFPFMKQQVQKTESLVTSNASMYYTEDIAALRPLHIRESQSSNNGEMSTKTKNRFFRHVITKTLSSVYAIFVIVLGAILYVNDVLGTVGHSYVEVFQIYLFMIAITFYIFIHIDIRRHLQTQRLEELAFEEENAALADVTRDFHTRGPSKSTPLNLRYGNDPTLRDARFEEELEEPSVYRFNTGRHAGSLYLKLGAVAFCFGSMIHDGLVFSKRLDIAVTQLHSSCMNIIDLFTPALNLVFSFYQLYFIFKHSNIIIYRYQEIARFGVMHSIAVNLCVWFRTLVDETIDEFSRKWSGEGYDIKEATHKLPDLMKLVAEDPGWHPPAPPSAAVTFTASRGADSNHTLASLTICQAETVLANIAQEAAPYLYPFTIEYTLIAAAVWYLIWTNIGAPEESHRPPRPSPYIANDELTGSSDPHPNTKGTSSMIHVDCRSTNRGLFPGILVLVCTVISIIIFFVTIAAEEYTATALIINNVSELSLYCITAIVTIFAFRETSKLNLNPSAMRHTLDDFLLFIALPCFFIFSFFSIIAGIAAKNPLSIVVNTASMVQVILQTTFIFDGLRRCSNDQGLQKKKPGREMITFLIVCNVAMWTFSTFEIKRSETNPSQMLFYGEFEWSIISHLSVPLTIFYRFHSSVCLADIWRFAYQPAEPH